MTLGVFEDVVERVNGSEILAAEYMLISQLLGGHWDPRPAINATREILTAEDFSDERVRRLFSALWAAIAGSVLGGIIMLKVRINRALWVFGFVQITSIFGFAWLAHVGHNVYVLFAVVSFEYLGVGLGTVALIAYISQQTSIRFTATQFALLTALATLPRTAANASTGFIIEAIGYFNFFLVCAAAAIPGILLLFVVAPWSDTKHPESIP